MRYSAADQGPAKEAARASVGTACTAGVLFAVLVMGAAMLTEGPLSSGLWALSAVLPGVLVQDAVRFSYFTLKAPQRATLNDAIWGVAQLIAVVVLVRLDRANTPSLLLAWGGSGGVAAAFGLRQLGVLPGMRSVKAWLVGHRDLGPLLALEFFLISGPSQLTFYALGFATSLREVASLRAGQILVGPVNVLFRTARISLVAEGVRLNAVSASHLRRATIVTSATMALTAVIWGSALLLLPDDIGRWLLAENWPAAKRLVPLLATGAAARGATLGAAGGLRALGQARDALSARALIAPASVLAGLLGAAWFGAMGAAAGLGLTGVLAAVSYWRLFLTSVRAAEGGSATSSTTPRSEQEHEL